MKRHDDELTPEMEIVEGPPDSIVYRRPTVTYEEALGDPFGHIVAELDISRFRCAECGAVVMHFDEACLPTAVRIANAAFRYLTNRQVPAAAAIVEAILAEAGIKMP